MFGYNHGTNTDRAQYNIIIRVRTSKHIINIRVSIFDGTKRKDITTNGNISIGIQFYSVNNEIN